MSHFNSPFLSSFFHSISISRRVSIRVHQHRNDTDHDGFHSGNRQPAFLRLFIAIFIFFRLVKNSNACFTIFINIWVPDFYNEFYFRKNNSKDCPLIEIIVIYQTCWKAFHWIFVEFYQLSLPRVWVGTGALEGLRTGSGAAGAGCAEEPGFPPPAGPNWGRLGWGSGTGFRSLSIPSTGLVGPTCASPCHCLTQENILFYYYYCGPHHRVCGILVSPSGLNPDPWQWKRQVLTTGVLYFIAQLSNSLQPRQAPL